MCKEYYILAFLGIFIHFAVTILGRKNKETPFSLAYILTSGQNWLRLLLAFSSTWAILLMSDDVADLLNIQLSDGTPAKQVLSFFAGYFNHSLIKRLVGAFNNKTN
jgi:hypothetical protein